MFELGGDVQCLAMLLLHCSRQLVGSSGETLRPDRSAAHQTRTDGSQNNQHLCQIPTRGKLQVGITAFLRDLECIPVLYIACFDRPLGIFGVT